MDSFKFFSWNVNGIRAAVKKGLENTLKNSRADIFCLQEIKIDGKRREKEEFDFKQYAEFWNFAERPGYAGTAVLLEEDSLLQKSLKNYTEGIGDHIFDKEGRIQTLEFDKFFFINTYFPHTRHDLSRLPFKIKFNNTFYSYIEKLDNKKPIIIGGDFNAAHKEIDLARPKDNINNPGFLREEREWVSKFIDAGFVDTFRYLNPKKARYTWWSQRRGVREKNIGWRIDYFFVSRRLAKNIEKAYIKDRVFGSDHCPVGLEICL